MKLKTFFGSMAVALAVTYAALAAKLHGSADTGSDEGNIAKVTATMLDSSSYTRHRNHDEVAGRFLDRYVEMLDGNHLDFLQTDMEEFSPWRTNLADLVLKNGDTTPAHAILKRYQERLEQRNDHVQDLLKNTKFEFNGNDTWRWDRRKMAWPTDLVEAKQLWEQHLRHEYLQEKLANKKPEEIVKTLSRRYERNLHTVKQWKPDEVLEIYLTALAHAYDPHSDYLGRRQMEDFSISMNLSLFGVGASLQSDDGYCKIRELTPGGPAARSKLLHPGDRIVAVGQDGKEAVDIVDMSLTEAVGLIRGPKGTAVKLTIIPADSTDSSVRKTITLVRDEIKLEDQAAKARIVDTKGSQNAGIRLGVIELPSFYSGAETSRSGAHKSATADVARLVEKLKQEKVQGIVLDLRRNGGGSLEEAITLTGLFIKRGPVVQTRNPDGEVDVEDDPDSSVLYDGPLVVLTSRFTASASEILAGALQDYGRAVIVGDSSTFGKGTVQSVLPLGNVMSRSGLTVKEDPGALKMTIRKFYRPDGGSTQLKGVVSDIVLPSPTARIKVGEAEMPDPLPWDTVTPAQHVRLDEVAPYLNSLKARSAKRVAANQECKWLLEDVERAQRDMANPVLSLNEKQRQQEKSETEARVKARKEALEHRPASMQKQYEITLKNVDQPGLPQPMSNKEIAAKTESDELSEDAPEKAPAGKVAVSDPTLTEAENILSDYVSLLKDPSAGEVAHEAAPAKGQAL